MFKHLPLSIVAVSVLSLGAIASASALNGNAVEPSPTDTPTATTGATGTPSSTEAPTIEPTETPTPLPTEQQADTPAPSATPAATCNFEHQDQDEDADNDDREHADAGDHEEGDDCDDHGQTAQAIADTFGVPVEEVKAFHDQGCGFGVIFKAYKIAVATGQSVQDVLASCQDGEDQDDDGFSWGQEFHGLTDDQQQAMDALPKNLGQAVSGNHGNESHSERH